METTVISFYLLPLELIQNIFEKLNFKNKMIFRLCCIDFYEKLKIYDLLNINQKYKNKLNDNILFNLKYVKYLGASHNKKITNNGIKHMNLHTLYASGNMGITDDGIKHMNLYILYASNNTNITDSGIKHMKLHILDASYNKKITEHAAKRVSRLAR